MKKLLFAIAAVCCIAFTSSCTKVVVAQYGYDATELKYMTGYDSEAEAFITECKATNDSFNGKEFTETQYINAFDVIVTNYNNKHIFGTFKLFRDTQDNVIKSYTMTAAKE